MLRTASNRARGAALALLVGAALVVPGCIPSGIENSVPDTITVIAGRAGVDLNPYTNVLSSRQIGVLLFRGLLSVDASGMPTPDLAVEVPTVENGGMSPDKTEVTYRLDPEAEWTDGKPLTAADVVFTWELIKSGALTDDPRGMPDVQAVTAVDDHTVLLRLDEPNAPLAWHFVPYVLPKHVLEDSPDLASDDFWFHPTGARGRVVGRHIAGAQVDLEDPAGKLARIRIVFADTDVEARSVWESTGQAIWLMPPVGPTGGEKSDSVPSSRWQAFVMNSSAGHSTADLAVRQAFAKVATPTVTPGMMGPYGLPLGERTLDDAAISAALDRAGWKKRSDGRRFKAGKELVVNTLFNPVSEQEGNRIEYDMVLERFGGRIEPQASFQYTDYPGASRLVLGMDDANLLVFPIGVPYGWAWPFDSQDVPSDSHPAGLNVSRASDSKLDAAARHIREAGSTAELQEALRSAWARLEEQYLVWWDVQLPQDVLYKGVEGVKAQPFEELALRFADEWSIIGVDAGE